jgi:hypothetical protein
MSPARCVVDILHQCQPGLGHSAPGAAKFRVQGQGAIGKPRPGGNYPPDDGWRFGMRRLVVVGVVLQVTVTSNVLRRDRLADRYLWKAPGTRFCW